MVTRRLLHGIAVIGILVLLAAPVFPAEPLALHKHDSIVILGNTFAERLQLSGYLETFLHCRFPDHRLRVRNLGWSADEIDKMIRPLGFPKLVDELHDHQADVLLLCFGMNEAFGGPQRIEGFAHDLRRFVAHILHRPSRSDGARCPPLFWRPDADSKKLSCR